MFGEKLKIVITEKNLKQSDLANLLNVSTSTIVIYELRRRDPDSKIHGSSILILPAYTCISLNPRIYNS